MSNRSIQKATEKASRHYAQGGPSSLRVYRRQVESWVKGGLKGLPVQFSNRTKHAIARQAMGKHQKGCN